MQYLGFGNGSDGSATLSGTDAPIDSSCSGTASSTSLSATNASFADDKIILIHQSRGTGAGSWELNIIDSYTAGTITTLFPLINTYTDSGISQAQVLRLKEYTDVTVSGTLTAKAWDGNVGGIISFLASGKVTVSGTITAAGKGFVAPGSQGDEGDAGEGTAGSQVANQQTQNGSGGGGGRRGPDGGHVEGGHGGGGGNAIDGYSAGTRNTAGGGQGGAASGSSDLSSMTFGGAGGSGGAANSGSPGGRGGGIGGGIIAIFCATLEVSGAISVNGDAGGSSNDAGGAGGGGAAGSIYVACVTAILGTNLLTATGGDGGVCTGPFAGGAGSGSYGRIGVFACSISGTTNPTNSGTEGDHEWCQTFFHVGDN